MLYSLLHKDDSLRYVITAIIAKPQLIRNGMCLMGSDCMIEMMNMVPGFYQTEEEDETDEP